MAHQCNEGNFILKLRSFISLFHSGRTLHPPLVLSILRLFSVLRQWGYTHCQISLSLYLTHYEVLAEVVAAVRMLPDKSCALDPLPTPTLKYVIDVLAPFWLNYSIVHLQPAAFQPFSRLRTSHLAWKRSISILRICDPTVQSPTYQSFRSYLKHSLLASSLPISTQTGCYQDSSRRIELTTQRRPLCWRSWRTFFLQSTHEICLPLFCWTYQRPSTQSIMVFFCIDWTLPIRSWDQYNNVFNPTCQTCYSTCELDLPPHHPAPWCVVYPRVPSLVPYFSFCTAATCSWSLRAMDSARIYMLMTHRSMVNVVQRHTRNYNHASQRVSIMSLSGCVQIASN